MSLQIQESQLLASLSEKEKEASRLLLAYEDIVSEIEAENMELSSVRTQILDEFLRENLTPLFLAYTIKTSVTGDLILSIVPMAEGGQLEFDKLKTSIMWEDTNNIPLFYIINYLGKGIPWNNEGTKLNAST